MPSSPITILLADDEADLLESLRLAFRMEGYAVQTFAHGQAVLDYLEATPPLRPFALVSDILMPGLSGLDLIRLFKQRYPEQAAVAITGHGDKPMVMELLRSGCDDFLDKPFEPSEVLAAVRRALALCAEREQALRTRLAPPGAEAVGAGESPQVRLRAIEALEKEIQQTLPNTAVVPAEPSLPVGPFAVTLTGPEARIALQSDCVGGRSTALRTLCEELITRGVREVALDLRGVEDMDALALSVLCSLSEELHTSGGRLRFLEVASPIRLLFQHLGLSDGNTSLPTAA